MLTAVAERDNHLGISAEGIVRSEANLKAYIKEDSQRELRLDGFCPSRVPRVLHQSMRRYARRNWNSTLIFLKATTPLFKRNRSSLATATSGSSPQEEWSVMSGYHVGGDASR
jgi:hypothetical protein